MARTDRATRERVARQHEQQRGYSHLPNGFGCLQCSHVEEAPRDSHFDATDEEEATRLASVHAAVEAIKAHVTAHNSSQEEEEDVNGGRTALFSGDWLLVDENDASKGYRVAYEGTVYPDGYWSGGVQWYASHEVAKAIVAEQKDQAKESQDAGRMVLIEKLPFNNSVLCGGCQQRIHVNSDDTTECGGEGEGGCAWNIGEPYEDSDAPLDPTLVKAAADSHEMARTAEPIALVTYEPADGEFYTQLFVGGEVQVPSWTWYEVTEEADTIKEIVR